jgi:hypothetical protein
MSSYNPNQPPPYTAGYDPSPMPCRYDQPLPQHVHHNRHHYDRVVPRTRLLLPMARQDDYSEADTRAFERFWSAFCLGMAIWLSIILFTDSVEMMHSLVIGLRKVLKRILEELRNGGWED